MFLFIYSERLRVDQDMVTGTKFCMDQFYRGYATCKIPGIQKDTLNFYFKTGKSDYKGTGLEAIIGEKPLICENF